MPTSPKSEVRAAAAQIAPVWLDVEANLARMERALDEIAARGGADIVVFPECASQGYIKSASAPDYAAWAVAYRRTAQKVPGPFTDALGALARKHGCYLVSGMTEAHPTISTLIFNAAVLIDPDGKLLGVHRKAHLLGAEKTHFCEGNTLNVHETDLGNVSLMICADYRNPEMARSLALMGAEILCVPYAVPHTMLPDEGMFNRINSARAFENSNFIIACNRVGQEDDRMYFGQSCICDPYGRYLAMGEPDVEEVLIATLRRDDMEAARILYNRFHERRPDLYGIVVKSIDRIPG